MKIQPEMTKTHEITRTTVLNEFYKKGGQEKAPPRLAVYPLLGFGAAVHGKLVTFGVTRGCIAVASPWSSITWLISP
jgi:hypothetical protein